MSRCVGIGVVLARSLRRTCLMSSTRTLFTLLVLVWAVAPIAHSQDQAAPVSNATQPPAGMAELVIFNDSGKTLIPSDQKVTDNGKLLASLARQTYVKVAVAAGPHLLRPDPYLWKQEVR